MAFLTTSWFSDLLVLLLAVTIYLYFKFSAAFKYWQQLGIPVPQPDGFPFGHFSLVNPKPLSLYQKEMYDQLKNERLFGCYFLTKKILFIKDPELIKTILVKDFNYFHDRGLHMNTEVEPLAGNLSIMNGKEWRNLRIKLTPTFTSGKMKMMFPIVKDVGQVLQKIFEKGAKEPEMEVKDILSRYNTDVISSCAFGIEANSLENPDAIFRKMGSDFVNPTWTKFLSGMILFMFPNACKYLPIRNFPKHVSDFFIGAAKDTMEYRMANNIKRNDFFQLLMQLKNQGYIADADNPIKETEDQQKFTLEQAAAQAFIFFFAGFETSSTTLQFAMYELSLNPVIQTNLQKEVDQVLAKHGGEITYEGMQEMDLLDRVLAETLRKHPIANILVRENNADYKIPDTKIVLEKGTMVWVPMYGIHHDPEHYPIPEKFDPDRFLPEAKEKRHQYAYLPFGEGPRNCIGNRFAQMQMKVCLIVLLSNFTVTPCEKTPIPIVIDPKGDFHSPLGPLYFKISKRQ